MNAITSNTILSIVEDLGNNNYKEIVTRDTHVNSTFLYLSNGRPLMVYYDNNLGSSPLKNL